MHAYFNTLVIPGKPDKSWIPKISSCKLIHLAKHVKKQVGPAIELWISCNTQPQVLELVYELLLEGTILRFGTLDGKTHPGYLLPRTRYFPDPLLKDKVKITDLKNKKIEPEWFIKKGIAYKAIYRKGKIILYLNREIPTSWFFQKQIRVLEPITTPPKLT